MLYSKFDDEKIKAATVQSATPPALPPKNRNFSIQPYVHDVRSVLLDLTVELLEFRDGTTGGHVVRTRKYLKILIATMLKERVYHTRIARWDIGLVLIASRLHDIGKIAISDMILNKPGPLTPAEYDVMKTHVVTGLNIIRRMEKVAKELSFHYAKIIVANHHEKWDGSGYPLGLSGEKIPLEGRLMAIVDVFDALTSKRPYREALGAAEAREIIEQGRGTFFDPVLVDVFHKAFSRFARIAENYGRKGLLVPATLQNAVAQDWANTAYQAAFQNP